MSATSAPFGLRPIYHPTGIDRAQALGGGIGSGFGSNILKYQAVKMMTSGVLQPVTGTETFQGSFDGVEYTDSNGRRVVSNKWLASTVATDIVAYWWNDIATVYEIQADGSVAATAVGDIANLTTANLANGSTVTGLSAATLSSTLQGAAGTGQLRIINKSLDPSNDWGDAYTIVWVQVSAPQYGSNGTAV